MSWITTHKIWVVTLRNADSELHESNDDVGKIKLLKQVDHLHTNNRTLSTMNTLIKNSNRQQIWHYRDHKTWKTFLLEKLPFMRIIQSILIHCACNRKHGTLYIATLFTNHQRRSVQDWTQIPPVQVLVHTTLPPENYWGVNQLICLLSTCRPVLCLHIQRLEQIPQSSP